MLIGGDTGKSSPATAGDLVLRSRVEGWLVRLGVAWAPCWVLKEQACAPVGVGLFWMGHLHSGSGPSPVWGWVGPGGCGWLFVENCTVDASIFVVKLLRADGGCLGTGSR